MSDFDPTVSYVSLPRFPGYLFGDDGSIWSRWRPGRWRRLKGWLHKDGYPSVELRGGDGEKRSYLVHRLILEAFRGPCPEGLEGCHDDGDPLNCRLSNLRWDSHRANMHDAIRHGTFRVNIQRGSRHGHAKLTEADIPEIRRLLIMGVKQVEIARRFGVDRYQIWSIKHGHTWIHVPD
jgi:hypothetical protein